MITHPSCPVQRGDLFVNNVPSLLDAISCRGIVSKTKLVGRQGYIALSGGSRIFQRPSKFLGSDNDPIYVTVYVEPCDIFSHIMDRCFHFDNVVCT